MNFYIMKYSICDSLQLWKISEKRPTNRKSNNLKDFKNTKRKKKNITSKKTTCKNKYQWIFVIS